MVVDPVAPDSLTSNSVHQPASGAASATTSTGSVAAVAAVDRLRITRHGTLVFRTASAADSGVYACTPYSTLGKGQPSAPIHVFVKGKIAVVIYGIASYVILSYLILCSL